MSAAVPPVTSRAPTPLARQWVRYVTGFGVGIAVGLAPYLGKLHVPGFDALLTLIPETEQATALPLSAAVMGTLAVCVQWYGAERLPRTRLRRAFNRTLAVFLFGLLTLAVVGTYTVVRVDVPAINGSRSYLVGFNRPDEAPCPRSARISDETCIRDSLTTEPRRVRDFWGDRAIRTARLALLAPYLVTTGAFGTLVGLLLLRGGQGEGKRR